MRQSRPTRHWGSMPFVQNGIGTLDLPLGLDLESLQLYLSGNIVIGTAYTSVFSEGIARLMKRVEVVANGEVVANLTGPMLLSGNFSRKGGVKKTNPGYTATTHACEAVSMLDFAHVGGVRPKDSILRTSGFRQLQLRITWGAWADVFGGAGVVTSNTLALRVAMRETAEHGESGKPEVRRLYRTIEKTYAASTQDRIPLDPNLLYRGLVIRAESAGELSGSVLTNAKVMVGNDVLFDLSESQIDDLNFHDYDVAMPDGFYVIDFAPAPSGQARISDFLDTTGRNGDAFLIVDVVGGATNKLEILSHQFQVDHNAAEANRVRRG